MKKVFKILGIIVIVILVLVGGVFGYIKIKQSVMNNERRNAKTLTLMEYVKTHDDSIACVNKQNCDKYYMKFTTKNFKCDALDNIKVLGNNYLITKDNEIYDISFNELYSNNQNCKKREINIDIKNIVRRGGIDEYLILTKNNKLYDINIDNEMKGQYPSFAKTLLNDNNITHIIHTDQNNNYDDNMSREIMALVLKKDNKIYKQYYNEKEIDTWDYKITFKREEVYKSLEEYGNIKLINLSSFYIGSSGKYYELESNTPTTIISDKGYYYLDEVKTDECIKYKDIECKLELKESEIYKKFSKDIKVIGEQYTILSDNSVIWTGYLTYPLDKDLKN